MGNTTNLKKPTKTYLNKINTNYIYMNMKQHNLKMPIDLLERFKTLADEKQIKVSKLIRHSMELYISEERQTSIADEDKIIMPITLKVANLINRNDIHSLCLINAIVSEIWMCYTVKIGYSIHPSETLFSIEQILSCGLSLEEVHDDRQKIVSDYTSYYIERYLNK